MDPSAASDLEDDEAAAHSPSPQPSPARGEGAWHRVCLVIRKKRELFFWLLKPRSLDELPHFPSPLAGEGWGEGMPASNSLFRPCEKRSDEAI
jgi:hypothetical protein